MKTSVPTILIGFFLSVFAVSTASAWTSLNHDWTIPGTDGRYGIQEIEKSGTAIPHGKTTLLRFGAHTQYVSCPFWIIVCGATVCLVVVLGACALVTSTRKGTRSREIKAIP